MIKILILLILTIPTVLNAQDNSCKNKVVNDLEKRDYTKSSTFSFDVDGDGEKDVFTHRTYKIKVAGKTKIKETHWISFDLKTSSGKTLKSFFKYKYGTNLADYWIYALIPCQLNKDKKIDLLFYTGDDTSDETIILENRIQFFKIYSRTSKIY